MHGSPPPASAVFAAEADDDCWWLIAAGVGVVSEQLGRCLSKHPAHSAPCLMDCCPCCFPCCRVLLPPARVPSQPSPPLPPSPSQAGVEPDEIAAQLEVLAADEPGCVDALTLTDSPDPLPYHTTKLHSPPR